MLSREAISNDLIAGLTVTLVGLPQCLAYAMMSGLPPAYGLSTAAVAGFVAALAGKSSGVITGPTNTTGLLILAALTPHLGPEGLLEPSGLPFLASLALLAGALRLVGAQLGAAALVRFIPESVLTGFTAGAGLLIAIMQLDEALGLSGVRGSNLWSQGGAIWGTQSSVSAMAIGVTALTMLLMAIGRRMFPRWPVPLMVIVVAAIVAPALRALGSLPIVADRAQVPSGWPQGALPSLDPQVYLDFLAPALAIVLLGTMELTVSARRDGAQPDLKREMMAQGWANIAGAFGSAFPASASLTRSALLQLGNAKTRLAAASAALFVIPILLFGGGLVGQIPQASLAGVLFLTAYKMINVGRMRRIWNTSPSARVLLLGTFLATITLPFVWAIVLGVGTALLIELSAIGHARLTLLSLRGESIAPYDANQSCERVVVEVSGPLFYAAAYGLGPRLLAMIPEGCELVILDLSHAIHPRFAAVEALEFLQFKLRDRDQRLGVAGIEPRFNAALQRLGVELISSAYDPAPGAAVKACLQKMES